MRSRRIWNLASGVDDGPAGASLLVCIAMGPRTSCLKSKLAWTSYRREAAVATFAQTSSCPRRGRGVAYGSWHGASGRLEARRDVVDAVDADEPLVRCSPRGGGGAKLKLFERVLSL